MNSDPTSEAIRLAKIVILPSLILDNHFFMLQRPYLRPFDFSPASQAIMWWGMRASGVSGRGCWRAERAVGMPASEAILPLEATDCACTIILQFHVQYTMPKSIESTKTNCMQTCHIFNIFENYTYFGTFWCKS